MTQIAIEILQAAPNSYKSALASALSGKTGITSAGYPYIEESCFQKFLAEVPFLFRRGNELLSVLDQAKIELGAHADSAEKTDCSRSLRVLETVIQTAAVTAPPDLWVVRHVWDTHRKLGLVDLLAGGDWLAPKQIADALHLSLAQVAIDLSLLRSRGYLAHKAGRYQYSSLAQTKDMITHLAPLPVLPSDLVPCMKAVLQGAAKDYETETTRAFLTGLPASKDYIGWPAGPLQTEIGFRVVPLVLALRTLNLSKDLVAGLPITDKAPHLTEEMQEVLLAAGYLTPQGQVTSYGARVFARGPGPFGIIHAYHSYMAHLPELLRGEKIQSWVARGENVAASQDANRKTFTMANNALDRFCERYQFFFDVFVEHAVGQGEATRQRYERSKDRNIHYYGADLEDAAIDKAMEAQKRGELPGNMQFIRNADIGQPHVVLEGIKRSGNKTENAVMVVGNGFHEVRHQTNEKMIQVFRDYCAAGMLIIFTEESGLADEDLLLTAWNTYHAGFRYMHEISGQGLRPALDKDDATDESQPVRYSWKKCATLAGYCILEDFTTRTRKIFPHPRTDGYNPAISVNYFCIPNALARRLKLEPAI